MEPSRAPSGAPARAEARRDRAGPAAHRRRARRSPSERRGQADSRLPARAGRVSTYPGRGELRGLDPAGHAPGRAPRRHLLATGSGGRRSRSCRGRGPTSARALPASDPTGGLRAYPVDLLQSPPDQREASFAVSDGLRSRHRSRRRGRRAGDHRSRPGRLRRGADERQRPWPADPAAARLGLRLGRAPRPFARPRQDDGRRISRREPRTAQGRGPARPDGDDHPYIGGLRPGADHAGRLGLRAARGPLPVARRRVGRDGDRDRALGDLDATAALAGDESRARPRSSPHARSWRPLPCPRPQPQP